MNSVVVSIYGGLGNQLFQYAAGRSLANKTDSLLTLDTSILEFAKGSDQITKRNFALWPFNIDAKVQSLRNLNSPLSKVFLRLSKRAPLTHRIINSEYRFYPENSFEYDDRLFSVVPPVWIDGHWQSYKYFHEIDDIIRKEIIPVVPLSPESSDLIERIYCSESIAIHIRRGDYITNFNAAKMHGICSMDYYIDGLEIVAKTMKNPHCFIFSDDPEWARLHFKISCNSTIVDINGEDRAYEDLWLMAACKSFIIANSTFSWWGAWLSSHKDKLVVAPKNWFIAPEIRTFDLLPESWIKI